MANEREADPTRIRYRVREAVGVFHAVEWLEDAIVALQEAGFDRSQINLLSSLEAAERKLGRPIRDVRELEDEPEIPHGNPIDHHELAEGRAALTAGLAGIGSLVAIGTVVATGGGLGLLLAAAALAGGLGGGIGALVAKYLGDRHAGAIQRQLERGGLLLWVTLRDPEQERKAVEILKAHGAEDVHVHEIEHSWGAEEVPIRRWQPDPFLLPP
ncbi:MAG: hypothetical protein N2038_06695 [Geminicoccaceae bacterium]|nr:hypothetical protein [Geminicoccaceae bacterium]MCX7629922.1 hypothetical protein [Geminicoccaceae bacterium]MDW8124665.1 hypothetical protein [Geminicoccaceae bacterium]MDW8342373.1 hypothetical protein [Geminicoccaceae bacterium]